ncbi:MAG: 1-(5-phosphoribosyl)-5-[(5-phosphoribosylamino)methylideneamino]imidazole-4-carboxamide isomerase [SAR202 cluster bacterium]|nr:1-(5-phosphoribosyl)-5-[(5-phosphoribosylamino)methylideneamino]imidazole-4-carboxamide isomerase [SAR202 cluster bacterium]
MEVIPAIDLRGGRCVRLFQGDYGKETVYSDDPAGVARRWHAAGATRIHVVDLDGARDGVPGNRQAVARIAAATPLPIQLGGGIRTAVGAVGAIESGAGRVVFGTAAIETPDEVKGAIKRLGAERVIVSVDARKGKVATRGWTNATEVDAVDLMRNMIDAGVGRFMYTDIARDGTSAHPNFESIEAILGLIDRPIIAAGGIAEIADLERLARIGVEAAVCGKAIYTGEIELAEAIRRVSEIKS